MQNFILKSELFIDDSMIPSFDNSCLFVFWEKTRLKKTLSKQFGVVEQPEKINSP